MKQPLRDFQGSYGGVESKPHAKWGLLHGIRRRLGSPPIVDYILDCRSHCRARADARDREHGSQRQAASEDPADADERGSRPVGPFAELRAQLLCDALRIHRAA